MKALHATGRRLWMARALIGLGAVGALHAEEPAAAQNDAGKARAEAIRQTLAALDKQVADHGGWDPWVASLRPYRDDIQAYLTEWQKYKWPWPARNGYVFQGAAVKIQTLERLDDQPEGERPFESILHFDRQLKALGIDLIVAIIPAKLSLYPDYIQAAVEGDARPARVPEDRIVSLAVLRLMHRLLQNDVEVINLHEAFREFRRQQGDEAPLFYVRDGHYLNRGARLAAQEVAERLKRYDFVQKALAGENPYVGEKGARSDGAKTDNDLLLIKDRHGRPYADRADSPIVVLGDSHLWYNGGTAHFNGQLAHRIAMPVALNWKEGLSATIPLEVAKDPNLGKRRVVVVHYTERMLQPKAGNKWPIVDLPGAKKETASVAEPGQVKDVMATGIVAEASSPPDTKASYPHYLMKFHVTDLKDPAGRPIGTGDGVVHVLAMHNRKVLPVAGTRAGRPLALRVTSWSLVEKRYGKIQSGNLPTVTLEIEKPLLWGEVEGQPRLTDGELARVGQEDSTAARAAADADPPRPPSGAAPAAVAPETTPREAAQGESTWRLELGACVAGKPLVVYLACREGKPWRAFGQTPTYNKAVHDVEIAELKVADGRVSGPLVLTVHPDAWVPSDGKPVAGRVDVRAEARDGKVTGTYEGRLGAAAVKGSVSGEVETGDLVPAGKVELLLENALQGEQPHYRTLNVSLPIVRGQFGTGGSVRGFHPRAWTGKIEKMDARLTPGAIAGRIEVSVQSGITPVGEGVYSFDLDGAVIGKVTAGSFKAGYKGGSLPGGKFFGKIVP